MLGIVLLSMTIGTAVWNWQWRGRFGDCRRRTIAKRQSDGYHDDVG